MKESAFSKNVFINLTPKQKSIETETASNTCFNIEPHFHVPAAQLDHTRT